MDYSTFLKRPQDCVVKGIVKDKSNNTFILYNEGKDINSIMSIMKIDNTGEKLLGEFRLPPASIGTGLAIDNNNDVYACGFNGALDGSFPATEGAAQYEKKSIGLTGIIIKLKGNSFETKAEIVYATYLGAEGLTTDLINSIAIDSNRNVWVTGQTMSYNFPIVKESAYQSEFSGQMNAFITKINNSGSKFLYSTFLGGKLIDSGNDITIDNNNNVYVTGTADQLGEGSPEDQGYFNVTKDCYQEKFGGGNSDAFVIKLDTSYNVKYCSYLGGNGDDGGLAVTCDNEGNVYVAGSTTGNFDITKDAYQKIYYGGEQSIFLSKINSDGTNLDYSTYFGGSNNNIANAIKIDNKGNIFIVGSTSSSDFKTTKGAYKTTYCNGETDGFLSKFNINNNRLIYSTFIGGSKNDTVNDIALGDLPIVYISGATNSSDFPTTPNAYCDKYISKKNDGFAMKLISENSPVTKIDIPDHNLEIAINQILKRDENHSITDCDMRNLPKELNLASKGITNLKGLEYATNLTKLIINDNQIDTLAYLNTLYHLTYLDAQNNKIQSIMPLKSLNNLHTLYLDNNRIEYINALLYLNKLTTLSLSKNEVDSIASLANLKQLEFLDMSNNKIESLLPIMDLNNLNNENFSNQKIREKIIKKRIEEDVILYLDFLWNIDGTLPNIINISDKGILSGDKIIWKGITTNKYVFFTFTGTETFNGTVTIPIKIKDSLNHLLFNDNLIKSKKIYK